MQHRYYMEQGSRKQGQTWGIKLVGFLMEAVMNIWNKRNSMEHNRVAHGLTEVENVRLSLEVDKQLRMGFRDVKEEINIFQIYERKNMVSIWGVD